MKYIHCTLWLQKSSASQRRARLSASKPNFEVGSSSQIKLSFGKAAIKPGEFMLALSRVGFICCKCTLASDCGLKVFLCSSGSQCCQDVDTLCQRHGRRWCGEVIPGLLQILIFSQKHPEIIKKCQDCTIYRQNITKSLKSLYEIQKLAANSA